MLLIWSFDKDLYMFVLYAFTLLEANLMKYLQPEVLA
jgi:hypothetical protein